MVRLVAASPCFALLGALRHAKHDTEQPPGFLRAALGPLSQLPVASALQIGHFLLDLAAENSRSLGTTRSRNQRRLRGDEARFEW